MIDEVLDRLDQAHLFRLAIDDGQQDHAEAFLHGGVLVELVEDDLRLGSALEFDDDAHAIAIAFVAQVGDVFDGLIVDQSGHTLDQVALVHLIWNLSDDTGLAIFAEGLDGGTGPHHEASATGAEAFQNSGAALEDPSYWEI